MSVTINFDLKKTAQRVNNDVRLVFERIGQDAKAEAKKNAPKSPTMAQISSTLVRKRRTKRKSFAGGLEQSITYEVKNAKGEVSAAIFVAKESHAGDYAKRIHDEKGVKWFKRGKGTVAKGARADEKYIERAVYDNLERYKKMIADAVKKGTK